MGAHIVLRRKSLIGQLKFTRPLTLVFEGKGRSEATAPALYKRAGQVEQRLIRATFVLPGALGLSLVPSECGGWAVLKAVKPASPVAKHPHLKRGLRLHSITVANQRAVPMEGRTYADALGALKVAGRPLMLEFFDPT
jgi:hypothetical protein